MRKYEKNNLRLPLIFLLCVLFSVCVAGLFEIKSAGAESEGAYGLRFDAYSVTYDISDNCSISVTEDITVKYLGVQSTGFIRDIPVDGAQVRNVKVEKPDGEEAWYDVYYDSSEEGFNDFLCVDIGDPDVRKYNQTERYVLTYTYNITDGSVNSGLLPVNPVFHGGGCEINDVYVTLIAPKGYTGATCYVGIKGSTDTDDSFKVATQSDGRTVITWQREHLDENVGVTFDLRFEEGAIKSYSAFTNYIFVIIGAGILLVLILLIVFVFNKNRLMPVVNYEAPDKMDPLIMGKLIDNKVNGEDVTSLIYYWASKGYIKINLDDKDDPLLIRITRSLPLSCPDYERYMYDNLFKGDDTVKPSRLKHGFYTVVEQTTAMVNKHAKGLYNSTSIGISVLFAVLGAALLGFAPMIIALTQISVKLFMLVPFLILIPALAIYALTETVKYNALKYDKKKVILYSCGIALLCAAVGLIYLLIVPASILSVYEKIILYIISALIFTLSVLVISRTREYTEKLNDVTGFRNFISLAEKPQLEKMLEDDPQFYYNILPYAQVLGVTDKWEEKFADLTVEPPKWLTGDALTTYFEFRIFCGILRSSMGKISSGMISRPSSSGSNGGRGFGGGSGGGGFSGGGFGGGGVRGR